MGAGWRLFGIPLGSAEVQRSLAVRRPSAFLGRGQHSGDQLDERVLRCFCLAAWTPCGRAVLFVVPGRSNSSSSSSIKEKKHQDAGPPEADKHGVRDGKTLPAPNSEEAAHYPAANCCKITPPVTPQDDITAVQRVRNGLNQVL